MKASLAAVIICISLGVLTSFACAWVPPIGIPDPGWGITTPVTPTLPSSWTGAVAGFYYVDSDNLASTDTPGGIEITDANGCRYGWPAVPRQTIPSNCGAGPVNLLAGSVVDLAPGKVYSPSHASPNTIIAAGTSANPVFIISSITNKATPNCLWQVAGTYLIIEGLHFTVGCAGGLGTDGAMQMLDQTSAGGTGNSDHIAFRHNEHEGLNGTNTTNSSTSGNHTSGTTITNVVIYDDLCHHNGVYQINVALDDDKDCWTVSEYSTNVWILDSTFYSNSNDGVQINACASPGCTWWPQTNHIYVGRNTIHDMRENCFFSKQAQDIIVSQNTCYNIVSTVDGSGDGTGMGTQYGPDQIWFIFNRIHDMEYGIRNESTLTLTQGGSIYTIGNVIYNTKVGPYAVAWNGTDGDADFSCLSFRNASQTNRSVNDTLVNCGHGINGTGGMPGLTTVNELISNPGCSPSSCPGAQHLSAPLDIPVDFPRTLCGTATCLINWGGTQYATLSSFQAAHPGLAAGSVEGDPLFVNYTASDFHLQAGSPAIGAGILDSVYSTFQTRYGLSIQVNFDGNPLPAAPDIGAF